MNPGGPQRCTGMTTYVVIHGAGSTAWYWHLVAPRLRARGHDVVVPELPVDDDAAGLAEYTDAVVDAVGDRRDLVLVAQSMAGFTAPLVCERVPVELVVLVAGMVPAPGESPGEWWANTGHAEARRAAAQRAGWTFDLDDEVATFLHDLPCDLATEAGRHIRRQSGTPFAAQWPLGAWPDVPTRFLLCRQDRFFPAEFQRRVVQDRLGFPPDEMDGGHLPALSRPDDLVDRLEAYRTARAAAG
jgi:pimeloyl-ACP methyl ester carboxylesterase